MTSETPSYNQSTPNKQPYWIAWLFLFVSLAGFVDAAYLTAKHYLGTPVPCSFFTGCEQVLTSRYSLVMGIPAALLGALYYLVFFLSTIFYFDGRRAVILKLLSYFSIAGFLSSAWFVYVQLFIIRAICEFCLLSAITSALLFVFGMIHLTDTRRQTVS